MPDTFVKIASVTVGSGGASSIDFTSIPSTYTDLVMKVSARTSASNVSRAVNLTFNGSGSNKSSKVLYGEGTGTGSLNYASQIWIIDGTNAALATSNTFSSFEVYLPNYASSNNKSMSIDTVTETNATVATMGFTAGLWADSAAITSITVTPEGAGFVQYSTAVLYGIKNS